MGYTFKDFAEGRIAIFAGSGERLKAFVAACVQNDLRWCERTKLSEAGGSVFVRNEWLFVERHADWNELHLSCTRPNIPHIDLPDSALLEQPIDPWAKFLAGGCYIRVKKDEWPAFAERCIADGIKTWGHNESVKRLPCDFQIGDYTDGVGEDAFVERATLNAYNSKANRTDMPIVTFSDVNMKKREFARGDIVRIVEIGGNFEVGDVVQIDETICDDVPMCVRLRDGKRAAVYLFRMRLATPDEIRLVKPEPNKAIITANEREITARLIADKQTVCEGKATCSPDDAYRFGPGAVLALFRTLESDEDRDLAMNLIGEERMRQWEPRIPNIREMVGARRKGGSSVKMAQEIAGMVLEAIAAGLNEGKKP